MECGPFDPGIESVSGEGVKTLIYCDSDDIKTIVRMSKFKLFSLESLILAQDERWRRA